MTQAATSNPTANGTVAPVVPPRQSPKASQAPTRAGVLSDPSAAIGLAVTQINAGKLDEADQLLTGIIDDTDKATPNLGAHVARGTSRALRRELPGEIQTPNSEFLRCAPESAA